ncbi:MAG: glutamate-5-semialdehyde dehydrogenase [Alphaproteobacteria bacterium CG11_big_fil_rev_8_21_14_0_20_39_49]|nr:MAG: glutamate-5-semialdehyde dehydrogenase [Alphaproteobacteria bacterium CG11_big_fil_rev_8_21_14_0_20_39_49]
MKSMQKSSDDVANQMERIGKNAKAAASVIANASTQDKNKALTEIAKSLRTRKNDIIAANKLDVDEGIKKGLDKAMVDRLALDEKRIEAMASGLEAIARLADPVGRELANWDRPSGLNILRVSVPLGVIGIIYESRPNVTADAGALCIKSGNAAILRGGSESFNSSNLIVECIHTGLKAAGLPEDVVQIVPTTDREAVGELLTMTDYVDVIVPRGGKGLCKRVQDESKVPTLQHLDGNCHIYVNESADIDIALKVIKNAKLRRTGICGATESLVVDKAIAEKIIPLICDALESCEVRGDSDACDIDSRIKPANEEDWDTEYLDSIISLKVIDNLQDAIAFVNKHSSGHTDAIIASDDNAATEFLNRIDSAIVMLNTSTQFADGGEFGMGAEIGISTGRLHARGPVGVEQLTTYKYVVKSNGSIRA